MIEAITSQGDIITNQTPLQRLRKVGRPRAIVIVPSRQLLEQITKVAKTMAHHCKLRVVGLHSRTGNAAETLSTPVDLLIITPNMLKDLIDSSTITFSKTRHIVMDEADSLFDKHYDLEIKPLVETAIKSSMTQNEKCSFILITATFPKSLDTVINSQFGLVTRLTNSSLHRAPKGLNQQFLRLDGSTTKENMLIDVIKRASHDTNRMLIFCNKRTTVNEVYKNLISKNIKAIALSSEKHHADLKKDLGTFLDESETDFMACVATDVASRGIDTIDVGHVVLYDFPHTTISYLHRVGRTARFGRSGRATSLLVKKDIQLAMTIKDSIKAREALSQ
jgi:superfamily II DNA/RNA helicase